MVKHNRLSVASFKEAGAALSAQDQAHEDAVERERERAQRERIELDKISDRASSTRTLNEAHVASLAESIAVVGLIQPIAVDRHARLLAGGHRLAALKLMRETNRETFDKAFGDGVPVRRYAFDANKEPDLALGVEVAENEHRRDYTKEEVTALISRLTKAGYKDTAGRPKAGEKALGPALEVVLGKSLRTVRRVIAQRKGTAPEPDTSPEHAMKVVRRALETFLANTSGSRRDDVADLRDRARTFKAKIEKNLGID